jgi:diguanylate cyclase (GGDEF)-like protein
MVRHKSPSGPEREFLAARARNRRWLALIVPVVLAGVFASFLGARVVMNNDNESARQSATAASTQIASTLELAIQHEQDLAISFAAFIHDSPTATQDQFSDHVAALRAFSRYPEVQGLAELLLVRQSGLKSFVAKANATLPPGQHFTVQLPGVRPYYCFTTLFSSRAGQSSAFLGLDLCDGTLGPLIMKARDVGDSAYLPYGAGLLVLGQPVYSGNAIPATVRARQAAFIGWIGMEITPSVVLNSVLNNYPRMKVLFKYEGTAVRQSFEAGPTSAKSPWDVINLHNGWFVETYGAVLTSAILTDPNAAGTLFGGSLFILLLGYLFFALGTGRSRAVQMVHERTDELSHQAFHDPLTGLSNRALILDRTNQMIARSRRDGTPMGLLFLDLDDFKFINDTLGHEAGDQLLCAVGSRLANALREVDTVGRLGGDEFVVLVEGFSPHSGVRAAADRILELLQPPFQIRASAAQLDVSASIGIAEGVRATPEELLRDADIALYRAKETGKRCAVQFTSSMRDAVDQHRSLDVDLRRAIENDEFFLLYQPVFNLPTGAITGVEALLRWRHPTRGVVQPNEFIPLLESSGSIVAVGRWVVETACRQGARWADQGHAITMSVNFAAAQLERDDVIDDVRTALSLSRLSPERLVIEITETTLMIDVQQTLARLRELKAIGVRIAIDDFGTGYSSFAYLAQFPIDVLKIDKSFISAIADSLSTAAIVHTLIELGRMLGLQIVAEGVENDEQRRFLVSEKVSTVQGFLFARPMEARDVERLLNGTAGYSPLALASS